MAAAWRYLKRDCPVCNGARKDCRENTHTGLIHCRYDEVSSVPGLKFTGLDALGFNMWAPDDWREGWKEAEWERVRLAKRKRQTSEPQLSRLSVQERDSEARRAKRRSPIPLSAASESDNPKYPALLTPPTRETANTG